MGKIINTMRDLRRQEEQEFKAWLENNGGEVVVKESITNDDGEEEYYYPNDDMVTAMVQKYDEEPFRAVIHKIYIGKVFDRGRICFVFSKQDDDYTNSFTDEDIDVGNDLELTFELGELEYIMEEIKERNK